MALKSKRRENGSVSTFTVIAGLFGAGALLSLGQRAEEKMAVKADKLWNKLSDEDKSTNDDGTETITITAPKEKLPVEES